MLIWGGNLSVCRIEAGYVVVESSMQSMDIFNEDGR